MRKRAYNRILLGTFLLGTTALVTPAAAQAFNNQVNASALVTTNTGNVLSGAQLGVPQVIDGGIGNSIGAGATGAQGIASVNQTISQSSIQQGSLVQGGNQVVVTTISATNQPNMAPNAPAAANVEAVVSLGGMAIIGVPNFAGPTITASGGGTGNSIGAFATGAGAAAGIFQSFDNNTSFDPTTLAANQVQTGAITAINGGTYIDPQTNASVTSTVLAFLNAGAPALIGGGIGNSISAQAAGASVSATVNSNVFESSTGGAFNAPTSNVVQTGALSATNRGVVTALGFTASVQPGTISNGVGNSMGAVASGASAGASVGQAIESTGSLVPSLLASNAVSTGAISAFNGKSGTVTAILGGPGGPNQPPIPVGTATITTGVGNTIMAQATGAGASGSVVQRFDNVTASALGGLPPSFAPSNSVSTGPISARNRGNVFAYASTFPPLTNPNASLISGGVGNTIGASAAGASASLSVGEMAADSQFFATSPVLGNNANLNGSTGLFARNGGTASVVATFATSGPTQIANGTANATGAWVVGASANAAINQSFVNSVIEPASVGANTVRVRATESNRALVAETSKTSSVTAIFNQTGTGKTSILDGVANSIGGSAAGASVSAAISSRFDNTTILANGPGDSFSQPTNQVDTTGLATTPGNLFARNNGTVTASFSPPFNATGGDLAISTGVTNSIGASALGAGASAAVSQSFTVEQLTALSQLAPQFVIPNTVTTGAIEARNNGAVASTLVATGNVSIGDPINPSGFGGVGNAISAQGTGAMAAASVTSRFYNVPELLSSPPNNLLPSSNSVMSGNLTASNNGLVTVNATIGSSGLGATTIANGVANFIGASASGASAGASIGQSVSAAVNALSMDLTPLPDNSVRVGSISATNTSVFAPNNPTGSVTATLTVNNPVQIGFAGPGFSTGNIGNSVSAQAIGASASASITTQVYNVTLIEPILPPLVTPTNNVHAASLSSTNSGPVFASANFTGNAFSGLTIGGGIGNSIGASAVGASSIASINQQTSSTLSSNFLGGSTLNTLTPNIVNVSSINATNSASITASLTTAPGGGFNSIVGGVGNSISANAVGSMAGASISQSIANAR